MPQKLIFDIRYDNELAHEYYGSGKMLAERIREIYRDWNLQIPDIFVSTLTTPPIHFMQVVATDGTTAEELRGVIVPPGLNVSILDFPQ
ncbi:hypothetical protein HCH54_005228 [Aspergillus fumigatus]